MASPSNNGTLLAIGAASLLAVGGVVRARSTGSRLGGSRSIGTVLSDGTRLSEPNKGVLCGALSGLLAVLRAMHISIHEGHWTASGPNFYSDHLLLERVYAGTGGGPVLQDDIDGLGERIVAYCGPEFVDSRVVTKKALGLIDAWHDATPSPVSRALHAEESLQVALRAVYDALRQSADHGGGPVPLGLDDFLMAMASAHDTNRYLLQQRVSLQDRP